MSLGPMEIILIVLVVVILFGGKKIPELARGLGKAMNEFKKVSREINSEIKNDLNDGKKTA